MGVTGSRYAAALLNFHRRINPMKHRKLAGAAMLWFSFASANAAPATAVQEDDGFTTLKSTLQSRFPDVPVDGIAMTPVSGLFEVRSGDRLVYVDATGDFLLMGPLVDTQSKRNLTEDRIAALQSIKYSELPLHRAIKVVKGTGQREFAVFADPDCPYCQQLEKTLEEMTDVTVYTFLFPLETLHPGATERAHRIWCAADPGAAWTQWMLTDVLTPSDACAGSPVPEIQDLAARLKVNSTPTIFLSSGRRVNGAVPREQLEGLLDAATGVTEELVE